MQVKQDSLERARALPHLPIGEDREPVFAEPWQAQVFALTLSLYEAGVFTWPEWADRLSREIKRAQAEGDPDLGDTYYSHWLAALEGLSAEKGVVTGDALAARKQDWHDAYMATPHGEPVSLNALKGTP